MFGSFITVAGLVALGLFTSTYIALLMIPITREAVRLTQQRRSSFRLSDRIEQGQIQVNSGEYWQAIEALLPDQKGSL